MNYDQAKAALATSAVDVSSFSATSPGGTGGSPTTARRPGIGPDTDRQPRPMNG